MSIIGPHEPMATEPLRICYKSAGRFRDEPALIRPREGTEERR